jgi:hypothetical protein
MLDVIDLHPIAVKAAALEMMYDVACIQSGNIKRSLSLFGATLAGLQKDYQNVETRHLDRDGCFGF